MKSVQNIEIVMNSFPKWDFSEIVFIKAFSWDLNNLMIEAYCQSRTTSNVWPDMSNPFVVLKLMFENTRDLKMHIYGKGMWQISGFSVYDISDHGLEKANFEISDYENGDIQFKCEGIQIVSISDPIFLT